MKLNETPEQQISKLKFWLRMSMVTMVASTLILLTCIIILGNRMSDNQLESNKVIVRLQMENQANIHLLTKLKEQSVNNTTKTNHEITTN